MPKWSTFKLAILEESNGMSRQIIKFIHKHDNFILLCVRISQKTRKLAV